MKSNFSDDHLSSYLNFTKGQQQLFRNFWILPQAVLVVLIVSILCLIILFKIYEKTINKKDKRIKILWKIFKILLILILSRYIASNGFLLIGLIDYQNDDLCKVSFIVMCTLYNLCCSLSFNFVWLRSYIIYKNPF